MSRILTVPEAIEILRDGGVIGFPTETVYGLAADPKNAQAIDKLFSIKGRSKNNPFTIHIGQSQDMAYWGRDIPDLAWKLADEYWPGPLTLIVKRGSHVLPTMNAGLDTVGIRMPDHKITLSLLQQYDHGLAGTSANLSGHAECVTAQAVIDLFGEQIDGVLEGGVSELKIASTVLDLTVSPPKILRAGALELDTLGSGLLF